MIKDSIYMVLVYCLFFLLLYRRVLKSFLEIVFLVVIWLFLLLVLVLDNFFDKDLIFCIKKFEFVERDV